MTIRRLFRAIYGLFHILILAIGVIAALLVVNQRSLETSQRVRFESYLLADELRQTSDDMTRFVRTYVATGDPEYEKYYWDVLAIRNGTKPRPARYQRIYWDLVAADGGFRRADTEATPLKGLMSNLGFTEREFAKLHEAQRNSDALVRTENIAMHAMKGLYDDGTGKFTKRGKPNQALAIRITNDAAYHREKAKIMRPIDDFFAMLDARTSAAMHRYERRSALYLELIVVMLLALLALTLVSSAIIRRRVTYPVTLLEQETEMVAADIDRLADVAMRISEGKLTEAFTTVTQRLDLESSDEIGQLALMHNHMVARLQEAGESIAKITADLGERGVMLKARNNELRERNARLRELESLRDSLTNMIVHDMRTPLTSIYGYLRTFEEFEARTLSDEGREQVKILMDETLNLIEMISSLLDVSKMEHGEMRLDLSEFDMVSAAQDVISGLESLRDDRQVILEASGSPIPVRADAQLISRVFRNLLGNALKFTRSNGAISIGIEPGEQDIRVTVRDDGPGIPEEFRDRIFEKFGQVEAREHQQKYSTGLGLTFCKLAVEAHGGSIGVESEVGKGSAFWFVLPRKAKRTR